MINLPCNVPLLPHIMPSQNVPVQTNHNTFPTFQQPQMTTQQMQTSPSILYSSNPQDPFKHPFYQHHQADVFVANHQYQPNIISPRTAWPPLYQASPNIPPTVQTQPTYNSLPQNVLDQIRNTVSSAAPIFILPGGCHQPSNHQQSGPLNQGGMPHQIGQSTGVNSPASIYCPPSFYPYPIPMPVFDPFGAQARSKDCCTHCHKKQGGLDSRNHPLSCCCNLEEQEEHRCTATNDDTICSKRNCPGSISLQALASQLLSLPGIISCAATRLILRKVPGSNIASTMEDTMDKAQKSISTLNKDRLLVESRNAQQVNALINLHMTTNPPANIIPLLTLLQLKVNVLKAQVESLITKKVMESQGYGYEVETSGPIDPTVLTMKTSAELRQLLSALRQKECDERVNANFSPYHSQKVIAEARLNNVQAKIRQVEEEFERRRGISVPAPAPSLTSRVIQQFSESTCTFGFAKLFEPYVQGSSLDSPDPFEQSIRNPKRLCLKARKAEPETAQQDEGSKTITTSENGTSTCKDTGTGEGAVSSVKEKGVEPKSSEDTCSCEESSSEESFDEGKKKLRLRIDEKGKVTITSAGSLQDVSLLKLAPNIVTKIEKTPAKNGKGGEEKPEEKKRLSIETEVTKEEDKETRDDDSGVQPLDIKEEDVDKEFEIITISDDDDEGTKIETFDSEKLKVKEEPGSDPDVGKETDVKAERESKEHVKTIEKEPESNEKMEISDREDIPIEKEPEEDDQKTSRYTTTMTINVKPKEKTMGLHIEPKIETKKSSDYATVSVEKKPEEDHKVDEKPILYTTTATMRMEPKTEPTFEYVAPIAKIVPEKTRTPDRAHISVKEEPEDEKPAYYTKLTSIPKPKKIIPHFYKPKVKAETGAPVDGSAIEKRVATNKDTPEQSKTNLKVGPKSNKNPTSSRSPFQKARDKFERDTRALKEKQIEDVSKDQETGSETALDGQTPQKKSSDLFTTTGTLTLKPAKKMVVKKQQIKAEPASNTNFDDSESPKADQKGENVQIVSMMTHIEYDRKFGNFWEWNTNECPGEEASDPCERNLTDVNSVNAITEDDWCILPEGVNPPVMSAIQQCESNGESQRIALIEEIFPKNLRTSDEKTANGHRHFPPFQQADSKAERTTPTDISENIFPCKEIEPNPLKTVCDRSSSYHCDSKMKNSIFSAIYSTIENQLVSFSSLLTSIPYIQTITSNGHFKKLSCNTCDESRLLRRTINDIRNNTMMKDDWILLPLNVSAYNGDGNGTSDGNRVSVSKGHSNVREMKQSIIVNKKRKNYLLIGGSNSGQLRELSRNGFTRPYQIRRSLIIRSRLKNFANSKQECLPPFKIFKRFKRNKILVSRAARQTEHQLKSNQIFFSLLRIPEETETLSNNKLSNEFVEISENEILGRNSKHEHDVNNNYDNNSVCAIRCLTGSKRVSNHFIVDEEENNEQV